MSNWKYSESSAEKGVISLRVEVTNEYQDHKNVFFLISFSDKGLTVNCSNEQKNTNLPQLSISLDHLNIEYDAEIKNRKGESLFRVERKESGLLIELREISITGNSFFDYLEIIENDLGYVVDVIGSYNMDAPLLMETYMLNCESILV